MTTLNFATSAFVKWFIIMQTDHANVSLNVFDMAHDILKLIMQQLLDKPVRIMLPIIRHCLRQVVSRNTFATTSTRAANHVTGE